MNVVVVKVVGKRAGRIADEIGRPGDGVHSAKPADRMIENGGIGEHPSGVIIVVGRRLKKRAFHTGDRGVVQVVVDAQNVARIPRGSPAATVEAERILGPAVGTVIENRPSEAVDEASVAEDPAATVKLAPPSKPFALNNWVIVLPLVPRKLYAYTRLVL